MRKREILLIAALVLAALAQPVILIARSFGNQAVQEAARLPFEGTARELYAQHGGLLNKAAAILWEHPEFFAQYRLKNENDASFPLYDLRRGSEPSHPFTEDEWQTLLQLTGQTWLGSIWYYWGRVPAMKLSIVTTADDTSTLMYLPQEGYPPQDVQRTLEYQTQFCERYVHPTGSDWYILYREPEKSPDADVK